MARQHAAPAPDRAKAPSSAARKAPNQGSTALILQRMDAAPQTIRPADILHLQRAIGNRATERIVQAKLKLGPAGDQYEQEADRVAQQVVHASRQPDVQRAGVDEDELQAKPLEGRISQLRRAYLASAGVQRAGMEEEELQAAPNHGLEGGDVDTDVARSIQSAKGGGAPLHDGVRSSMEKGFGADFGGVRVHTGGQADALNRSLNARAFTTGNDIFFGQGQYNPGSSGGQELIAHELTHTVQQGAAQHNRVQPSPRSTAASSAPVVQRFITREAMIKLGGKPSGRAELDNSAYVQILNLLDTYDQADDKDKKDILNQLTTLCDGWLQSHDNQSIRGRVIQGLKDEAQARKILKGDRLEENIRGISNAPSTSAAKQAARESTAADPDWANPNLGESPADKYIFTIAVATKFDELLDFAKARAHSMKRNKIRGALTIGLLTIRLT